jgi:phenylacetate-CoA ligase
MANPPVLECYFGAHPDRALEDWDAATLREYQTAAVAELLDHVADKSPFYKQKFAAEDVRRRDFRSLDDLVKFPFTTKDELRGDPWLLLSVERSEVRQVHTSTGTMGGRWSYLLYSEDDLNLRDHVPLPWKLFDVKPGDIVVDALPYDMSSSGQSFQRALQHRGCLVVPAGKGSIYSDPYKTVEIMAELGANVLITTPPYAMLLAEITAQTGVKPAPRLIWLTGEGCSPAYRRRIEQLWGCDARIFYGSMECGSISLEGPDKNGGYICAGHVLVEIVDEQTDAPLPPGQMGEIVCTVLQRRASPLIRFRTQDRGFIEPREETDAVLPRLQLRGRILDEAVVPPMLIENVLYAASGVGGNYQIYHENKRLVLDVELLPGANARAAAEQIRTGLMSLLDRLRLGQFRVELNWVEHIPRTAGKTRRIRPLADRTEVMAQASLLRRNWTVTLIS